MHNMSICCTFSPARRGRCCPSGMSYGFSKEASTCRIEAGFDVPLQAPCWHVCPEKYPVALGYSVRTTAFLPEPVRMCIRLCFGYWLQGLQVQGLHPTVFHSGNA